MKLVTMSLLLSASLYAGGDILPVEEITQFEKMDNVYLESNVENSYVAEENVVNDYADEGYSDNRYTDEGNVENSYVAEENVVNDYADESYSDNRYTDEGNVENSYVTEQSVPNGYTEALNIENSYVNEGNNYFVAENVVEEQDVDNNFKPTVIDNCVTTCGEPAQLLPYYGENIPDAITEPCFAEDPVLSDY